MDSSLPPILFSDRLVLRSYTFGDEGWYYQMSQRNREHLERYEPENPAMGIKTEEDAKKIISDLVNEWKKGSHYFMGVFLKESEQFVAQLYIGLVNRNVNEYGIGYFSDVEHEGKGYVTEGVNAVVKALFEMLDAHRIRIETDDTNVRSIGVAERCGFVREGHIRENKKNTDGTYSGTLYYGLLKSEFQRI
ncbi:MAG: GNAT family N-acetyltransferase [Candidatus Thorarchaeota archaeon]|jgi:ribosomal-protein-alanine N-acetyltransferase